MSLDFEEPQTIKRLSSGDGDMQLLGDAPTVKQRTYSLE